jgi:NAD(P)-dependent dehydrogenase (short-subunit alcohol dehydrogenase family)
MNDNQNNDAPKWVLITGAARRIGRAIALELAAEGWNIVLHYNHSAEDAAATAEEIIKLERRAALAEIDLARPDHVVKLIPSLAAELGPLTALVNNASLFELDTKDPDGKLHLAVNATAPRLLSEALYQQMPDGVTGAVVNILDGAPPEKGLTGYNASKAALKADTLALAAKFAPRIRVNGVAPGAVLPNVRQSPQHFQTQVQTSPLKTAITPGDIARAVHFLLTAPAITGEIIHVDGGNHLRGQDGY